MNKAFTEKKLTGNLLLVGRPENDADLAYATRFACPDEVVYLKTGRTEYLVVSSMEYARACAEARNRIKVLTPDRLGLDDGAVREGIRGWIQGLLRKTGVEGVSVSMKFPLGLAETLRARGIRIFVMEKPVFPQREIKEDAEIDPLRHAQRGAVRAMKSVVAMIAGASVKNDRGLWDAEGPVTSERIRRTINHVLLENDCLPSAEIIVAGGPQSALPHERGRGPLFAGTPIVVDVFPKSAHSGYWGDLTRTFFKGTPDRTLKRMYTGVREAHKMALGKVRAGISAATLHRSVRELFEKRGMPTGVNAQGLPYGFIHSTGHGVGLEIHEAPRVSASGKRLRKGNVITIEPGYYLPGIGGIRVEDTVVVTRTGFEFLCPCRVPARIP